MKLKYNFVTNEVAGKTVAVAVGDDAAEFNGFIKMNGTAAEIFKILKIDVTMEELTARLQEIYPDQTAEVLRKSAEGFVEELMTAGVLL